MTVEPLTPERRRAMTRRHLLDAAAVVFAENGFYSSTIDEVAKRAGFTKGAVYSNFTSKDDLFLALLDDRIDQQFAVLTEVLEHGPSGRSGQAPRVRDLLRSGGMGWDDTWETLFLEFVLYARRNEEAAAKLAERARRERAFVEQLIESEYAALGAVPRYPIRAFAEISMDLFSGFGIARLLDPDLITDETIDVALNLLWDSFGINDDE